MMIFFFQTNFCTIMSRTYTVVWRAQKVTHENVWEWELKCTNISDTVTSAYIERKKHIYMSVCVSQKPYFTN